MAGCVYIDLSLDSAHGAKIQTASDSSVILVIVFYIDESLSFALINFHL